jgi:hypothetical protein
MPPVVTTNPPGPLPPVFEGAGTKFSNVMDVAVQARSERAARETDRA